MLKSLRQFSNEIRMKYNINLEIFLKYIKYLNLVHEISSLVTPRDRAENMAYRVLPVDVENLICEGRFANFHPREIFTPVHFAS